MRRVCVLGGGPDAERDVSLESAAGIAAALRAHAGLEVVEVTIDRPSIREVSAIDADVIWPALHGGFGEGGPLQDLLEDDGRPYVGSGPRAARLAMDKIATKVLTLELGIVAAPGAAVNPTDDRLALDPPLVLKPIHEGSSVGLHVCRSEADVRGAVEAVRKDVRAHPGRAYMVEPLISGRELTVGVLDGDPLPTIEIIPAEEAYDYEAKYQRDDTRYELEPDLPEGVGERVSASAVRVCEALGVRHLARADFLLDDRAEAYLLEVNTMPGFTSHSLVPKAAHRIGLEMPALCARIVEMAIRDHG